MITTIPNFNIISELHLSVSLRLFRSKNVSNFVKSLLDVDINKSQNLFKEIKDKYPIYITRDLVLTKQWIHKKAKESQRYGIIASSGAKCLHTYGIWVQNKINAPIWFLNNKDDARSSLFLEETATEFDIQGLELDWSIMCWDANLRFNGTTFEYYSFTGTKWQNINKVENISYLKNAYRVLLTRARQGLIIFIPKGDDNDITRKCPYYDGVYKYLKDIGIEEIFNISNI